MISSDVSQNDMTTPSQYNNLRADMFQPGMIALYGSNTPPNGWLICNGAAISRSTYSNLFAVIGTSFGIGDGSSTFNIPDVRDKFLVGLSGSDDIGDTGGSFNVTLESANIPSHTHTISSDGSHYHNYSTYTNYNANGAYPINDTGAQVSVYFTGLASPSSHNHSATGGYGQTSPTAIDSTPTYIALNYIICTMTSNQVAAGDDMTASQYNNLRKDSGGVGLISQYGNITPPAGWLVCDGSGLDTTTYAALFAIIGYTFGGSGSTFNLPNVSDRFIIGVSSTRALGTINTNNITLAESNLPEHTHTLSDDTDHHADHTISAARGTGSFTCADGLRHGSNDLFPLYQVSNSGAHIHTLGNIGSGDSFELRPNSLSLVYIMRY